MAIKPSFYCLVVKQEQVSVAGSFISFNSFYVLIKRSTALKKGIAPTILFV